MARLSLLHRMEQAMGMTPAVWDRHANPWSVYTRFSCLPLIVLALWSRHWLGWSALIPFGSALLWTWTNPRLFPAPARLDSWASQVVLGERVYLHRKSEVSAHHLRCIRPLQALAGVSMLPMTYGVWALDLWPTLFGLSTAILFKLWFCDRMVWIWQDWQRAGKGRADL